MIKETSAGAVIYKIINNELLILVEYMSLGHISLAKGHLENDETLEMAALREIKEETSLDVVLDTNFVYKITYAPHLNKKNILKDVYFFVAKVIDNKQIPRDLHDNEVIKLKFVKEDEAYSLLTYELDKETLIKALEYIKRKENLL